MIISRINWSRYNLILKFSGYSIDSEDLLKMTITNYTNIIPGISFVSNNKINLIVISDYKSIALPTELQGHAQ